MAQIGRELFEGPHTQYLPQNRKKGSLAEAGSWRDWSLFLQKGLEQRGSVRRKKRGMNVCVCVGGGAVLPLCQLRGLEQAAPSCAVAASLCRGDRPLDSPEALVRRGWNPSAV